MEFFQQLGRNIERRWRDQNYNEAVFPDIAAAALAESSTNKQVDPWDIVRWVNATTELPEQFDVEGRFGNPPITLYVGPRFYIDVYYWLDGTTSIHQHAFCGAFQVLLGSSIHSRYRFENEKKINAHFSTGKILLGDVNLLGAGDIQRILPGRQYIHSLFHLDRPSATITVRTRFSPEGSPQLEYFKPYFAMDPFFTSPAMTRRVQTASLLLSMKHPETDALIGEALAASDFQTAFAIVETAYNHLTHDPIEKAFKLTAGRQRFEAYVENVRHRHGELADLIMPVIEEAQRQNDIALRRRQITTAEHRFFLALLLNVPDRARVLELVKLRCPDGDPVETVVDWVEELASTRVSGSTESNVLGIPGLDEEYLIVFQCLLEGLPVEEIKNELTKVSRENAGDSGDRHETLISDVRNLPLFKAIFLETPSQLPAGPSAGV